MSARLTTDTPCRTPLTHHTQPMFEGQPQSPPGLARDADPKPDHGQESYQGFGRLAGCRAIATGADSGVGCAVVIASPARVRTSC